MGAPLLGGRYVRHPHLIYRFIRDEAIVVNPVTNALTRLNATGSQIFKMLAEPLREEEILGRLASALGEPGAPDEQMRDDCREFTSQLLAMKLIYPESEAPPASGRLRVDDWRDEMDAAGMELLAPLWAKMEISTKCHLNCAHCYIPFSQRAPKGPFRVLRAQEEMTDAEILSCVDQLAGLGAILLTVTGGEIFARQNLLEILAHAHRQGFVLELFTSGTLMTEAKADALSALNIGRIQVSVYSASAERHDGFTGSPGSWKRSTDAIRMLTARGLHVDLACSIMPLNYDEILQVRDLAHSLGASCSYGYPITSRTNGDHDTHRHRLSPEQLRTAIEAVPEFFALPPVKEPSQRICPAGVNMCAIAATGEVYSCSQFMLPAGNIREQRLQDIWLHSPALRRIRELRTSDLKPSQLGALDSYVGLCPGMNLLEEKDFLVPASVTAEATLAVWSVLNDPAADAAIKHSLLHPSGAMMRAESS